MNLKTNKCYQKLLLITFLLFNLILLCSSIPFNRISYPEDNEEVKKISNLLALEDNTLVFLNGTQSPIKVYFSRSDGNLISLDLKFPLNLKYVIDYKMALKSNYMLILYHEETYNTIKDPFADVFMYGMVLRSDGNIIHEQIPFGVLERTFKYTDFRAFINDDHLFWVFGWTLIRQSYTYAYLDISNIEEGIIAQWNGTYMFSDTAYDPTKPYAYGFDIVYTAFKEYMIIYYSRDQPDRLFYAYLRPNIVNNTSYIIVYNRIPDPSRINCQIDPIDSHICYCLIDTGNYFLWVTFDYTLLSMDRTFRDYMVDLSVGYHSMITTPITHRGGFLVIGYTNVEVLQFTVFILNGTNSIQQAYIPVWRDVEPQNEQENQAWLNELLHYIKVNVYCQEVFIPIDALHEVSIDTEVSVENDNYYFKLLPNNTLILGEYDLWSTDLTPLVIKADSITQRIMLNDTTDLERNPPSVVFNPSTNVPIPVDSKLINITFDRPISLYKNNITIYQIDNSKRILRQIFDNNSIQQNIILDKSENTVTLTIIESTFNIPGAIYSLEIDDQFFKHSTGINSSVLSNRLSIQYNTESKEYKFAGKATVLLRLTEDGTNLFEGYKDKSSFLKNLAEGLAEYIPLKDSSQIKFNDNYALDKNINRRQILLPLSINPPVNKVNNINVEQIINSLDIMIKNSGVTPLSTNNYTKYLDSNYGCLMQNDLLDRYKYILIGIACAGIILIVLFFFARKKYKEGSNLIIFKVALLSVDMVSDFLFVIESSGNVEFLRIPSIIFLVIPIITNLILVFHIFITECMENKNYLNWFKENSQPAAIITILCGGDITALKLLSSHLAGFELFNAPLSKKAEKYIYYGGILNIFLEDLPQLIIQIIYNNKTITYDIIPLISLTTGSIILSSTILGHFYDIIIKIYMKMKGDDVVFNKLHNNTLEECEGCGENAKCKHIIVCEKCIDDF
ncbi:hypothetical protein C1645_811489 [Glomus cerebriforme]|uniref:Uncharacterized protein n=1 Tax=Glomus cerebriforme TaxID=658196 RepID=A0A397TS43_9GLOM|nr:hypothetical protein C1645_811489 [Glomus cerebriforme]